MPGRARKRSLTIAGHRTSISLEDGFWSALKEVAKAQDRSVTEVVSEIDAGRDGIGLSGAIRIYLLEHYRQRALRAER
ncbi:MAG: ribbon-helix-helix domain-containing protein [Methyloligellaceae bacterium]